MSAKKKVKAPAISKRVLTNRVFTCLWKGEDLPRFCNDVYSAYYVECLAKGIRKHVPHGHLTVLADEHYAPLLIDNPKLKGVKVEPFQGHGIGGWTNIFEICREDLRPKLGKRHVWVGLDSVFVGPSQWIWDWSLSPVGLPLDPYHAPLPCNGVWSFDFEGAAFVWDAYKVAKEDGMKDYMLFGSASEMLLLRYLYKEMRWQPLENSPKRLLSYKAHVLKLRNPLLGTPSVIYGHGKPKPHQLPRHDLWRQLWENP